MSVIKELVEEVSQVAQEKKADSIVAYQIEEGSHLLVDYVLFMTVKNTIHVKSLSQDRIASCGGSGLDEFGSLSTRNVCQQDATENYLQSRDGIQAVCGGTCRVDRV